MVDRLLFSDNDWSFSRLDAVDRACAQIAQEELGLDTYPNQLELISAEQMLDAYASIGLPVYYAHWSFGKQHAIESGQYKRGEMGLAYELVINSNPCISYLMEENTMTMQTLVIAHAAYGHNAFFKNNVFFQQWTDAEGILDYLSFAQAYIAACEERYGIQEVSAVLDAAHAIARNGIDRARRPRKLSAREEEMRRQERERYLEQQLSEIWRTLPPTSSPERPAQESRFPPEPTENLLYFIEKNAPQMPSWQREILRIVRKINQYLYPQGQTKIMNEGFACFVHYYIMHRLHETGQITDGSLLEFYASHTAVVFQPDYDDPRYSGINPYALGFAIFRDIQRICSAPTEEDRRFFAFAGDPDWKKQVLFAMREFRDDSFILQYLSPKVIRDLHLFALHNDPENAAYRVTAIHDDAGYREIRERLAQQVAQSSRPPNIVIDKVDRWGDRHLELRQLDAMPLSEKDAQSTLEMIQRLWGYDVFLSGNHPEFSLSARRD
ncbi:SpoVR family protein [Acidithiobacillus sp. AMEEHan]|uniref:SpoVR family protein n=1 Tax=Acidithiobacillus sp. AMEEHan TaxID=2994951 RepID=UPI0027E57A37|nr:SpoVR family protein [Acidithiobacillus sp. AMEEHan]